MEVACDIEMIKDPETRRSNVTYVARHIEDSLTTQREYRAGCMVRLRHCLAKNCCLWFGKRYGNFLISLYLIVKALYIMNVIGQFFLINAFLGSSYTFYGLDLLRDLSMGVEWSVSGNFPRVTLCDFRVRKVGSNLHKHTVQCVLPINMFNEKIFIFIWFWLVLVSAVTISSFLYWSYKFSIRNNRIQFVRKFLKLRDALEPGNKKRTYAFVDEYLRPDGVFIVRLISQNAGELVASEIVERLWQMYKQHQAPPVLTQISDNEKAGLNRNSIGKKSKQQRSSIMPRSKSPLPYATAPPLPPPSSMQFQLGPRPPALPPPVLASIPPPLPPHPSGPATVARSDTSTPATASSTSTSGVGAAQSSGKAVLGDSCAENSSGDKKHLLKKDAASATAGLSASSKKSSNSKTNTSNEEDPGEFV